jgi:hypothetical protein
MEARYQRDWDFMLGRILNEYLKQNQVYNIEPLIIEVNIFALLTDMSALFLKDSALGKQVKVSN